MQEMCSWCWRTLRPATLRSSRRPRSSTTPRTSIGESATSYLSFAILFRASRERVSGNGHISTVSSVGTIAARPTAGLYQRTRCALEAIADALAAEVAGFGIEVTIIEPAAFHPEFITEPAIKNSRTIAAYNAVRKKLYAMVPPAFW